MSAVGELAEVILFVKDMNKQVVFYRDTMGFEVRSPGAQSDYAKEFWVELNTGACSLCLHAGGEGRYGEDAPKIVFRVKDIGATHAALKQKEVPLSVAEYWPLGEVELICCPGAKTFTVLP